MLITNAKVIDNRVCFLSKPSSQWGEGLLKKHRSNEAIATVGIRGIYALCDLSDVVKGNPKYNPEVEINFGVAKQDVLRTIVGNIGNTMGNVGIIALGTVGK